MRSVIKMTGVAALVVAALVSLSACSSATPEAFDASTVSCATVVHEISSTKTALSDAKSSLKDDKGTPAESTAKANVTAANQKLTALNKRSTECNTTTKPASDIKSTDKGVSDAEASATLDENVWGHLTWKYPTRFVTLITKYKGADGMTTSDKVTRPDFTVCSNLPGRIWTDAVCVPNVSKSMEEVDAHILSEPDYGAHVGSGLAHSSIVGGKSLLELNPWLQEFADPAGINDWAQAAMDGSPAEQLVAAKKLAMVVMLLEQLNHESVGQHSTTFNYNLVVGEPNAAMTVSPKDPENTVKEFELNPIQYVGEFVTVQLTFKGQTGCWLQVGFNTGDGRFAGFACETPKPPTTSTSSCTTTNSCTTHNTPGCKETKSCVVPPKCTVPQNCPQPKDPKDDVKSPQGTTQLGADPVQPTAPVKTNPLNPGTGSTSDSGLPAGGASPAPSSSPAPSIPATQQPTVTDPGTHISDPG